MWLNHNRCHCVKSVPIRSFSGPFSVRVRQNTDQKNSEYGQFLRSADTTKSRNHFYSFIFYETLLLAQIFKCLSSISKIV